MTAMPTPEEIKKSVVNIKIYSGHEKITLFFSKRKG
jgi:hypothetical protein